MKIVWKDIPGYEGLYKISNSGEVKSSERWRNNRHGGYIKKESILIKLSSGNGYYVVKLFKNKSSKAYKIHVLVAMAFLNHKPNGYKLVVDHIDNDKSNNYIDNLQLITQRENSSKDNFRQNYSSKYVGVCWDKANNKWLAYININRNLKNLGRYNSEYKAHLAYQTALKKL